MAVRCGDANPRRLIRIFNSFLTHANWNYHKRIKEERIKPFTKKAQNLFQKYNRLPVNPKATVGEGSVTLDQVKLIDYNHIWAGQNKGEMVKAWRDRIGK